MSYKYTISDKGSNSKRSNDWNNAIKFAIQLAKENVGKHHLYQTPLRYLMMPIFCLVC